MDAHSLGGTRKHTRELVRDFTVLRPLHRFSYSRAGTPGATAGPTGGACAGVFAASRSCRQVCKPYCNTLRYVIGM